MVNQAKSPWSFADHTEDSLTDADLQFLSKYTKIQDLQILRERVSDLRREARESLHVYRCITMNGFLTPKLQQFPNFANVPKSGKILEIGTCFGTEVRGLLASGVEPKQIVACDVTDGYWKLGQKLYGDAPEGVAVEFTDLACKAQELSKNISVLQGTRDLVFALAVFHVLNEEQVECMVSNIARLLQKGGQFFGTCAGTDKAGPWIRDTNDGQDKQDPSQSRHLHSAESLSALFKKTGFSHVEVREMPRANKYAPTLGNSVLILAIQAIL